jgi:choline dehydrogenase-like flavoprotein
MSKYETILIGSGLAGVHAAYPLVERGLSVAIVDVGHASDVPHDSDTRTFEEIRRSDPEQYKIFLGSDFSGIDVGQGHFRAMVSGRRSFVVQGGEFHAPLSVNGIQIPQSFARGGFSEAWSGGCEIFDEEELEAVGLPPYEMREHYQRVIDRIGVSGEAEGFTLQKPLKLDDAASELQKRAVEKKKIRDQGFAVEQPKHAILTEDKNGRKAHQYRDMDYWDNGGRSLYRASYTLDDLLQKPKFSYISQRLVIRVRDSADGVEIVARNVESGREEKFAGKTAVLAAGAINTTRLLLRSFNRYNTAAPIILKNHYYIPCFFPPRLGKRARPHRHSFAQLCIHGVERSRGMSELYGQLLTYNSLLLSKLVRYAPLPVPEAFSALTMLTPALVFADLRFPSVMSEGHHVRLLKKLDRDELEITYPDDSKEEQDVVVSRAKKALRSLGLIPLMTERHGYTMQSHYAGGVPFEDKPSNRLSVNTKGQVHGHERIFVADASSWRALPAKPSGLTIMANADRVGNEAVRFCR